MASTGFADGARYDASRPGYPPAAVRELVRRCGIGASTRVLDLAAGTGKLTRELVALGADVVAVEPVDGMRAILSVEVPDVPILAGAAERIPLPDGEVEVVTAAQALHWFDPQPALAEIHRVLRGRGWLGLMWNVMDRSVGWVDRLQDVLHGRRGDHPWYAGHAWRQAFAESRLFGGLQRGSFTNVQRVDSTGLRERIASVSFVADIAPAERDAFLDEIVAIADAAPRDATGRLAVPYVTDVFWCRRRP